MTEFWGVHVILDDASKLGPKDHVSVFYETDGKKALIARLTRKNPQFPLQLMFTPEQNDDEIPITVEGKCHAYLYGYMFPTLDDQILNEYEDLVHEKALQEEDSEVDDDDEESEEEEEEEENAAQPQKRKQKEVKEIQPNKKEMKKSEEKPQKVEEKKKEDNKKEKTFEAKTDNNINSKIMKRLPQEQRKAIVSKFPYAVGQTVRYRNLNEGSEKIDQKSDPIKNGSKVTIKYIVRTFSDNKVLDKGNNFSFRFGREEVILGLEKGIRGLKKGCIRQLLIDPSEAYPDKGVLIFTCEVTNVQ